MQDDQTNYVSIMQEAESGDPHAMLALSKLYRSGALGDGDSDLDIDWLLEFFRCPVVRAFLYVIDEDGEKEPSDELYRSLAVMENVGFEEQARLQMDIVEAGVSLGLYYRNSRDKGELLIARDSLYNAWIASRFDYMEIPDGAAGVTDIVAVLASVDRRMGQLGYGEGGS